MALNPYENREGRLHRVADTTRRQFLILIGVIGGLGASLFGALELLKFMFPAATSEDPPQFKTLFGPDDMPEIGVKSITEKRVSIVRDKGGIYAVYLVCTHLGCTPNYNPAVTSGIPDANGTITERAKSRGERGASALADGWACPCHGSRYFIDSTNFYGPAPRPMDWVSVILTKDKKFFVDRSSLVAYRLPGDTTPPTWRLQTDGSVKGEKLGV